METHIRKHAEPGAEFLLLAEFQSLRGLPLCTIVVDSRPLFIKCVGHWFMYEPRCNRTGEQKYQDGLFHIGKTEAASEYFLVTRT